MRAIVTRTSEYKNKRPCDEARADDDAICHDWRTVKTLAETQKQFWYNQWYARGENHREENGMVVCDYRCNEMIWYVEFEDIDALLAFVDKYGNVVIERQDYVAGYVYCVEIYDSYRE